MDIGRRGFVGMAGGAAIGLVAAPALAAPGGIKAAAFDGLVVFDVRGVAAAAGRLFGERAAPLVQAWRTRQFEYTWLRSLTGRYADFLTVTDDALTFAAASVGIDVAPSQRRTLMEGFLALDAWPDAAPGLRRLKEAGLRTALLTNFSPRMIDANLRHAGLEALFDHRLSTDAVAAYKPHPRAYQLGVDAFGLASSEILFVASAGWDASGAAAFGYPTHWTNRPGLPPEEIGPKAATVSAGMPDLDLVQRVRS